MFSGGKGMQHVPFVVNAILGTSILSMIIIIGGGGGSSSSSSSSIGRRRSSMSMGAMIRLQGWW